MPLRFTTAGESHGPALVSILEGMPAGLSLLAEHVNTELARRQQGYGRGRRMQIEKDSIEFLSGVRAGETLGSPIAMLIHNRDWKNWQEIMDPAPRESDPSPRRRAVTRVRPGHADLTGILKYDRDDARDILERASARETTARVAAIVLEYTGEVRVSRTRAGHTPAPGTGVALAGRGIHDLLPVLPVAIMDQHRDRRPERFAGAHAGEEFDGVLLDLHAASAPIALLATRELNVHVVREQRQASGNPFHDRNECGAV